MHYDSWCVLSDEELAARDIAEVNLAAAFGLPMTGLLDVRRLRRQLDQWAGQVRENTRKLFRLRTSDEYRDLSEGRFRMLVLVTILQRDLGIKYNQDFARGAYDGRDSRNLFLHGLLNGHGGTCVTMPVLYAAVGRRLGYPIRLVLTKEHAFCRWDDPNGERFNVEATSRGFHDPADEYYHTWPKRLTAEQIAGGVYLQSLSPRQELAFFLGQRGSCWLDHLEFDRAAEAFFHAHQLAPRNSQYEYYWALANILRGIRFEPWVAGSIGGLGKATLPAPQADWKQNMYPQALGHLRRLADIHAERPTAMITGVR